MAIERTLSILKPDALESGVVGKVIAVFEQAGLKPVAMKMLQLTRAQAEGFYAVHRERGFFGELTDFMSSGKAVVMVLEAENGIVKWRETMGATDPAKAAAGTIRKELGESIQFNCTHGSDAQDTAAYEIAYFFSGAELV